MPTITNDKQRGLIVTLILRSGRRSSPTSNCFQMSLATEHQRSSMPGASATTGSAPMLPMRSLYLPSLRLRSTHSRKLLSSSGRRICSHRCMQARESTSCAQRPLLSATLLPSPCFWLCVCVVLCGCVCVCVRERECVCEREREASVHASTHLTLEEPAAGAEISNKKS